MHSRLLFHSKALRAHRPSSPKHSGLTLIELVVVLFVLMALVAIAIPLFPSLVERAHRASQGTNASEVTKSIQLYQSLYGTYPDGYDLLTDGNTMIDYMPAVDTASPMMYQGDTPGTGTSYLNPSYTYPVGGYVKPAALTANALAALNGAGITTEYALLAQAESSSTTYDTSAGTNATTGWQPTFNPYQSDNPATGQVPLSTSTQVVYVIPSGMLEAGLISPSALSGSQTQFVMFGLGRRSNAIGTVISNAPNNFPNDYVHEDPNKVYERFGLIFQVEDANKNALPAAIFVGAVAIESNTLVGTDKIEESYYQNLGQQSAPAAGPGI